MHYTGTIWRPPYEAASLLLEATAGCTHHRCKFCTLYNDLPFRFKMSPIKDIESDLQEAQLWGTDPVSMLTARLHLPMYLPKGARVIRTLQEWLRRDLYERGYEEVITPHIYNADVWKTSGHYGFYHENMYFFQINEGTDEEPRYSEPHLSPQ